MNSLDVEAQESPALRRRLPVFFGWVIVAVSFLASTCRSSRLSAGAVCDKWPVKRVFALILAVEAIVVLAYLVTNSQGTEK